MSASRVVLSACMIVRDEADLLPGALASLKGAVDEIVVVDTGSVDTTVVIAERAGAWVVHRQWKNDFSAARNAALDVARGDWCLMLDADETIQASSWPALQEFIARDDFDFGAVTVVSDSAEGIVKDTIVRVCRNDGRARYVGRIHEQLSGQGRRGRCGLIIDHHGYSAAMLAKRNKIERNLDLLRKELCDNPDDPYILYQLGHTLLNRDNPAEALPHLQEAMHKAPADAPYLHSVVRDLGYTLRALRQYPQAIELTRSFQRRYPRFTDLFFLEGLICLDMGDGLGMVRAFEICVALGEVCGYTSVEGVGSYRAHHNLGLCYELCGDLPSARQHYHRALGFHSSFAPTLQRLAVLGARREAIESKVIGR